MEQALQIVRDGREIADPHGEDDLRGRVARMEAMLLEQHAILLDLARALGDARVTRTEERAVRDAVRARAMDIAAREGWLDERGGKRLRRVGDAWLCPADRVAAAIRATVREITGVRAYGDIPRSQYDRVLRAVALWDMPGALRRIRKEWER